MSVNTIIINALKPFGYPCKPDIYTGKEKCYFTFNHEDERGGDYGDNEPGCIEHYMQIHLFCKIRDDDGSNVNYLDLKNKVREALFHAGFTYPVVTELSEPEKNIRHIVYECDITEEREED